MKKLIISLAVLLALPAPVFAAEPLNLYIAPKIIGGIETGKAAPYQKNFGRVDGISQSFSKGTFGGGVAIGYNFKKFNLPIRAELEFSTFTPVKKSKTYDLLGGGSGIDLKVTTKSSITALFANAYYDINTGTAFTPYVGAGLGVAWNSLSLDNLTLAVPGTGSFGGVGVSNKTTAQFAWNVGAGVAYAFTDNISVDLGYRYAQFGKGKTKTVIGMYDIKSTRPTAMHQFVLGLRVTF